MKLGLTEKQYKDLLTLVAEQADAPAAEPEAGTSDKQAGGQGYPEVGKWESGVTRGPANQIGVTKWADVVGAKLTRGKANMLKEQEGRGDAIAVDPEGDKRRASEKAASEAAENAKVNDFLNRFYVVRSTLGGSITLPKMVGTNQTTVKFFDNNSDTKLNDYFYDESASPKFKEFVDKNDDWCIPTHIQINDFFPEGTVENFTVNGVQYSLWIRLSKEDRIKKQRNWQYMGYRDFNEQPYDQSIYVNMSEVPSSLKKHDDGGFWEKYGNDILLAAGFLAMFIPVIGPELAFILNAGAVVNSIAQEKYADATMFMVFLFLPQIKGALGLGKAITEAEARELSVIFKDASIKGEEELAEQMSKLRPDLKRKVELLLKKSPDEVAKAIDNVVKDKVGRFSKEEVDVFLENVERAYKEGKIVPEVREFWLKRFGRWVAKHGGEFVVIGFIWSTLKAFEEIVKNSNQVPQEKKNEWMELVSDITKRYNQILKADLKGDIDLKIPMRLWEKYEDKYKNFFNDKNIPVENGEQVPKSEEYNIRMMKFVLTSYLSNQNQNFDNVMNNYFMSDTTEYNIMNNGMFKK